MQTTQKDWLVRTRAGEILGPYSAAELIDELNKRTFSADDEIAPSRGSWMSAQTLINRDVTEVTHTSTRSQTYSRSVSVSTSETDTIDLEEDIEIKAVDPLTSPSPATVASPPPTQSPIPDPIENEISVALQRLTPLLTVFLIVCAVAALILQMNPRKKEPVRDKNPSVSHSIDSDSPFIKKIYQMITSGKSQAALKALADYHEKQASKDEVEYLVPYAALLIMENEAPARAKKLLEQVLASGAGPQLKSRAHHWLGYQLLSQDEGDMGENHFLEALQLNPKDAAARFNLGRAYLKQEKYSQALDYLQLAELEAPDLWLIHIYKGTAKFKLDNMEEARVAFKTAVQSSPDRWLTYIYYGLFLMGIHETEAAQSTLRKMLTRDPGYELASPAPFGFYQEHVEYSAYLKALNQIMEKAPGEEREFGKLYLNYLLNAGNGSEGKRIEEHANRNRSLVPRVIALKIVLDRDGNSDELQKTLARLPANLSEFGYYAYVLRAEALKRLKQLPEALSEAEKALKLEPRAAIARLTHADILKELNRGKDAQTEVNLLLGYHPNYIPAIFSSHNF